MDILIGALVATAFFCCLFIAYLEGKKRANKAILVQLSEQEELEQQKRIKGFENVMAFDYDVAIGRRK